MNPSKDQVIADVNAAPTRERISAIYTWAAQAFAHDPQTLRQIGEACSQREAFLNQQAAPQFAPLPPPPGPPPQRQPMPHHEMPAQRPVQPMPGEGFETATPRPSPMSPLGPPPGYLGRADQNGLGTIHATGMGGTPALDVLRCELVNLAAASWDLGLDLSRIEGLRDVSAATPEKLWDIAAQMCNQIGNWAAERHRQTARATR